MRPGDEQKGAVRERRGIVTAEPTRASVTELLRQHPRGLTVREIARRSSWHTNTPWAVVFVAEALVSDGLAEWEKRRRSWKLRLRGK